MENVHDLYDLIKDMLETSVIDAKGFWSSEEGENFVEDFDNLLIKIVEEDHVDPDVANFLDKAKQVREEITEMIINEQMLSWAVAL